MGGYYDEGYAAPQQEVLMPTGTGTWMLLSQEVLMPTETGTWMLLSREVLMSTGTGTRIMWTMMAMVTLTETMMAMALKMQPKEPDTEHRKPIKSPHSCRGSQSNDLFLDDEMLSES